MFPTINKADFQRPSVDVQERYKELAGTQDVIIQTIQEIKSVLKNEMLSKAKAIQLYGLIVQYAAKQDDEFYTTLKVQHKDNQAALKIIDFFIQDLKFLKVRLFVFEDKYLADRWDNGRKWAADFLELSDEIVQRFQVEQDQLFPLLSPNGRSIAR